MAKTASLVDLTPDSGLNPKPAKAPRARRSRVPSESNDESEGPAWKAHAIDRAKPATSLVKPILIGVGIGAAVAVTGLALRARSQAAVNLKPPPRPQSTLTSALGKAALFAVGRLVAQRAARVLAQRAVGMLANRAVRQVAKAWIG